MKRTVCFLLTVFFVILFTACSGAGNGDDTLPPVKVIGVNEDEKLTSTLVKDGFSLNIYSTYSEITGYTGSSTVLELPSNAAGIPVRKIAENAFKGDGKIKKVVFSQGIRIIDRFAFEGCTALEEVILNDGLETIDDYAFRNCAVTKCALPDSVSTLGKYCFYGADLREIKLPESLSIAGKYCFYGNKNLISVTFSRRFSEVAENMFYNCSSLVIEEIPPTVKKIDSYAFRGCVSLGRLIVYPETEKIGDGAFYGCTGLTLVGKENSAIIKAARNNVWNYELSTEE